MIDGTRVRGVLAGITVLAAASVAALAATGPVQADVVGAMYSTGSSPVQAAATPDGKTLLVADGGSGDTLTDIDLADGTTTGVTVGSNPGAVAVSPDGHTAVVTDWGSNQLSVLDLAGAAATVTRTVTVDSMPQDVTISSNGQLAYVSCGGADKIDVVYLPTGTVLSRLTTGNDPQGLALSPDGRYLYVAEVGGVLRWDLDDTASTTQPWAGGTDTLSDVALSPDGTEAYVADLTADAVGVLQLGDFGDSGPIEVTGAGSAPTSVSASPDGTILYVADSGASNPSGHEAVDAVTEVVPGTDMRRNLDVAGSSASDVVVSPSGAQIYAIMRGSDQVRAFQTQPLSDTPAISGTAEVGDTVGLQPFWGREPSTLTVSYQWKANGHRVGRDKPTYTIPGAALGKHLTVTVTETVPEEERLRLTSIATRAVMKGTLTTSRPRIAGTRDVGGILTAVAGKWRPRPSYSYRWFAGGKRIRAATRKKWKVTAATRGMKVTVKVTGKKRGYRAVTVISTAVRVR